MLRKATMRNLAISTTWLLVAAPALAEEPTDYPLEAEEGEQYGDQGQFELGGSLGASISDDRQTITASPSFGYFIIDHLELSAILTLAYERTKNDIGGHDVSHTGTFLLEPSWHQPIARDLQLVVGIGVGGEYDGDHPNFVTTPRIGLNIITARSNVITPALRLPIEIGRSHGDTEGEVGTDVALVLEVGITTTW